MHKQNKKKIFARVVDVSILHTDWLCQRAQSINIFSQYRKREHLFSFVLALCTMSFARNLIPMCSNSFLPIFRFIQDDMNKTSDANIAVRVPMRIGAKTAHQITSHNGQCERNFSEQFSTQTKLQMHRWGGNSRNIQFYFVYLFIWKKKPHFHMTITIF